jgi:hypothetical protein
MLNKAILELNGIFNVKNQPLQRLATVTVAEPLQAVATAEVLYVTPKIKKEDFKSSMDNYRTAVHHYNKKVEKANAETLIYNIEIELAREKNPLTREQLSILISFNKMIAKLNIWERNERTVEFNRCQGPKSPQEKIQTIKYQTEQVFASILWHYNMQLNLRENRYRGIDIPSFLPHISLHTGWITNAKVNEVVRLDICQKTFRNHRRRLSEANILQDYIFEGSARPVKMKINPDILSITDKFFKGKDSTVNQHFIPDGRKELPHNNVSIGTLVNNIKIKANVENIQKEKIRSSGEKALTTHDISFYKNTRKQLQKKNNTRGKKTISQSDILLKKIEDPSDFVQNLASHHYDKYVPIRIEVLEKEVSYGTLDRDEFKELVLQDHFKIAAKLWKGKTPYAGSWANAYHTWKREKFVTHSGESSNKHITLARIEQLRYRVAGVGRYLKKHPDFQLLFPGDYFDVTRTTAKEGGFEYTSKMWKKHEGDLKRGKCKKKTRIAKAKMRKLRMTDIQKVHKHVSAYIRDKFSLDELITKVEQLGNRALTQKLPEIINKANIKFQLTK